MTSFIIVSNTHEAAQEKIDSLCQTYQITKLDKTLLPSTLDDEKNLSSLGIEEVKRMQQKVSLKPLESPYKAVILQKAELLTIPAQNALLKLLEEPPERTLLILQTTTLDALIPTIQSRCSIMHIENSSPTFTAEERVETQKILNTLRMGTIGDKLKHAEILSKNKEAALTFLERCLFIQREELLECETSEQLLFLSQEIDRFQETQLTLKTTNANPRLLLETLFLTLNR